MSNVITINRETFSARGLRGALAVAMLWWSFEAAAQEPAAPTVLPPVLVTAPPRVSSSAEQSPPKTSAQTTSSPTTGSIGRSYTRSEIADRYSSPTTSSPSA